MVEAIDPNIAIPVALTVASCLIWFVRLEGRVNVQGALQDELKEDVKEVKRDVKDILKELRSGHAQDQAWRAAEDDRYPGGHR